MYKRQPEQLKVVLEEIIAAPTENNFVTFEIKTIAPIAVQNKYAGIGASLVAYIKNTQTPFSIDFGVGDVIVPKQEKRKIPTQLDDLSLIHILALIPFTEWNLIGDFLAEAPAANGLFLMGHCLCAAVQMCIRDRYWRTSGKRPALRNMTRTG